MTSITTQAMFHDGEHDEQKLIFPEWSPKIFQDVPFVLSDPQGDRIANAIMLHVTNGDKPPRMPKSVSLTCNASVKLIQVLAGISGWGFPAVPADDPNSKFAYRLRGQQIRYFEITPKRLKKVEAIELAKSNDATSPVIMAITVEGP